MAEIFSSAYFTIAASGAESGEQGLWGREKMIEFTKAHDGVSYTVCVCGLIFHELRDSRHPSLGGEIIPFPTATSLTLRERAWCLQEELLSTRLVHSTRREVIFICLEGTICECEPCWMPRFQLPPLVGENDNNTSETWSEMTCHYSQRKITFWQDRLPALSSLTTIFEKDGGRYLAGLWEFHLLENLLWYSVGGCRAKPPNPSICSPPSWSWASIESGTIYPRMMETWYSMNNIAEVVESVVYPSTSDPRGMVSRGYVTLLGPLLPLQSAWQAQGGDCPFNPEDPGEFWGGLRLILRPSWCPQSDQSWRKDAEVVCDFDDIGNIWPMSENTVFEDAMFFVILGGPSNSHKIGSNCFEGLVVKRLTHLDDIQAKSMKGQESELAYARVGTGRMWIHQMDAEQVIDELTQRITIL